MLIRAPGLDPAEIEARDLAMRGRDRFINPDAHHTSEFRYLWFGTGAARKGRLTRHDVVNCLPLGKIESGLRAKRSALP